MTRKPLYLLGGLLLLAVGILLTLMATTTSPNDLKNGFDRRGLSDAPAIPLHELAVGATLYRISGASSHRFYFTCRDPRIIFSADMRLQHIDSLFVPFPISRRLIVAHDLRVDSPYVHLYANNLSSVLTARLDDTSVHARQLPSRLFTAVMPLPPHYLVVKAFDSSGIRQVFQKIDLLTNRIVREAPVIADNKDAGFSADGLLRYDSSTHHLFYVQFYQNRFFCIDSNLNVVYAGTTIDTTNYNPVLVKKMAAPDSTGSVMPSVPLHIVNRACLTTGGKMYIISTLRADNENNMTFRNNAVVDVYNSNNGSYRGSFYLPDLHGEKALNLFLANGLLLVSYDHYIASFTLPVR